MFTSAADRPVQGPLAPRSLAAGLVTSLVALALCVFAPAPAWSQEDPRSQAAAVAAEAETEPGTEPAEPAEVRVEAAPSEQGLAGELTARFEVLPTRSGLLLRPLAEGADFRTLDVSPGEVAIDGETVDDDELASRLGALAGSVRALAALPRDEARRLFGFEGPAPSQPVEPAETPETPGPAGETAAAGAAPVAPPRPPARPRRRAGERVTFAGSVTVDEDEVVEVAVAIGGDVRVEGEVEQDAVAVGGDVEVEGLVEGNAVAVGGSVYLGSESVVEGDVSSVGGKVVRHDGSHVGGQVSEVSMSRGVFGPGFWRGDRDRGASMWKRSVRGRVAAFGEVVSSIVGLLLLALLVWLVTVVARAPVERVAAKVEHETLRCLIAGFLFELLFVPVLVVLVIVLAISIIGIPLLVLVPFALLLIGIGLLLGFAGVARWTAHFLERRLGWHLQGTFLLVLVGVTAIQIWTIFARGLDAVGGPLHIFAAILWIFGIVIEFLAWTIGLGAVLLTRFGAGPKAIQAAAAPLPAAPIPDAAAAPTEPPPPAPPPPAAPEAAEEPPPPPPADAPSPFWEEEESEPEPEPEPELETDLAEEAPPEEDSNDSAQNEVDEPDKEDKP